MLFGLGRTLRHRSCTAMSTRPPRQCLSISQALSYHHINGYTRSNRWQLSIHQEGNTGAEDPGLQLDEGTTRTHVCSHDPQNVLPWTQIKGSTYAGPHLQETVVQYKQLSPTGCSCHCHQLLGLMVQPTSIM
jgi:hypothetical protein